MCRIAGVSLCVLLTVPLCAQAVDPKPELQDRAQATLLDPSLASPLASALSQISLISSGDETSLRAEIGVESGEWLLGLRIESAIEAGQSKADLVDFEGLTGKSKATFSATRMSFGRKFNPIGILRTCDAYNTELGPLDAVPPGPNGCGDLLAARAADPKAKESDQNLLKRSEEAVAKALVAVCTEYDIENHISVENDCKTVDDAKRVLPDDWDKKLDKKIAELRAPLCTLACAAIFKDRADDWDALEKERNKNGELLKPDEKLKAERDRAWRTRVQAAEQEALTAICTDYNKSGADPVFAEDCRDAATFKDKVPDDWDAKLDEKTIELVAKVCQDFNATRPASWGWLETSGKSACTLSKLQEKGASWVAEAVRETRFSPNIFSFSAALDRQDFEYIVIGPLDPDVPPKEKLDDPTTQSEFGIAITGAYGKLFFTGRSFLYAGGGVSLTRAFKGGPTKQICRPSDTMGVALCEDIVTAAPTQTDRQTLHAEARWFPFKHLGIIPRLAYEFDEEVATSQLTAFFLTHETKGLNGGIDLAYRDDGKGFVARLFIGTSFSLLP